MDSLKFNTCLKKYIYADVVNGCQYIDNVDARDYQRVYEPASYEEADSLLKEATDPIVLLVNTEICGQIETEYGIH